MNTAIPEYVYIAARAILAQMAHINEYIRALQQVCIDEQITMDELFAQFDTMLETTQDTEFFSALKAYYYTHTFV